MELEKVILTRRTTRKFTDYVVTEEEINKIMELARWTPSWANTQSWEFVIIRDKEKMEKIADLYSKNNAAIKCAKKASVLIIGCIKNRIAGYKKEETWTKFENESWGMYDLGAAVQNISLEIHNLGLGSVIVGAMDHNKIKEIIKLPENYEVVVSLAVGKPFEIKKEGPRRKELKEFVYLDEFGKIR